MLGGVLAVPVLLFFHMFGCLFYMFHGSVTPLSLSPGLARPYRQLPILPRNRVGNILAIVSAYTVCLVDVVVWLIAGSVDLIRSLRSPLDWLPPTPPKPPDPHSARSRRRRFLSALTIFLSLPCIQARSWGGSSSGFIARKIQCGQWSPSKRSSLKDLLRASSKGFGSLVPTDGFRAVVDTGCSKIATFDKQDFVDSTFHASSGTYMGGIASGLAILGTGTVRYEVLDDMGHVKVFEGPAVLVENLPIRLLPPQRLMPTRSLGSYSINGEDGGFFNFSSDGGRVATPLDPSTGSTKQIFGFNSIAPTYYPQRELETYTSCNGQRVRTSLTQNPSRFSTSAECISTLQQFQNCSQYIQHRYSHTCTHVQDHHGSTPDNTCQYKHVQARTRYAKYGNHSAKFG